MGNGPGIVDPKSLAITEDMIEEMMTKAQSNFGTTPIIFVPPSFFLPGWNDAHPQYSGTPWAQKDRLTKREHTVAQLHIVLKKLKVLKKLSDEDLQDLYNSSIKRLKRSRWAKKVWTKI